MNLNCEFNLTLQFIDEYYGTKEINNQEMMRWPSKIQQKLNN